MNRTGPGKSQSCFSETTMSQIRPAIALLMLLGPLAIVVSSARSDALAKLQSDKLAAVHHAIESLRTERQILARPGPYKDYRANLHVHSKWSHDSRGAIEEIVAAAKAVGTSVLMFTEHPADSYD